MRKFLWIGLIVLVTTQYGLCQSTVFTAFGNLLDQADKNFEEENYHDAITQYETFLKKKPSDRNTILKLARAYYRLKKYVPAVANYDIYSDRGKNPLTPKDLFDYAEAQAALKHYPIASTSYRQLLESDPNNSIVAQKIWRIDNLKYLFEDSTHFAVRPVPLNTNAGELCPVATSEGLLFLSNRKRNSMVENINGKLNTPFYELYRATINVDTVSGLNNIKGKPSVFYGGSTTRLNKGPLALYNQNTQMVFVSTSETTSENGGRTLGLYFAVQEKNKWRPTYSFPHNSSAYSIYDVSISKDGSILYFTSDMKGGKGGKDIYTSEWKDGGWSKPENAGEIINTPHDESFPYLHEGGVLFFSSNGHPGLGGLDLFKVPITPQGYGEPQNLGYPMNSNLDDFGISFDLSTHGYFTSNRKNGAYDDDIYEFDMDLQTYPFTISGIIKFKEHSWSNQAELRPWANVRFSLMDSPGGTSVFDGTTDNAGQFSLTIPYFSRFYIRIIDNEGKEHKASLELQRYRVDTHVHEIVVVKDIY